MKQEKTVIFEQSLSERSTGSIAMNAEILLLHLARCLVLQLSVRSLRIAKLDIVVNSRLEIFLSGILCDKVFSLGKLAARAEISIDGTTIPPSKGEGHFSFPRLYSLYGRWRRGISCRRGCNSTPSNVSFCKMTLRAMA